MYGSTAHGVAWSGIIGSDNSGVKGRTPYSAALELHHGKIWLEENLDNNCEANFPFLSSPPVTANCRPAGVDRRSSSDKFLPETVETIGRVSVVRINYCQVNRDIERTNIIQTFLSSNKLFIFKLSFYC